MKVFLRFRLDPVNHILWHDDKRGELAPKAFNVLRYLVEHSDRLVTQEEMLEALWPGTHVNSEVIKKYVLGIRKALGDHSQQPAFISTFPRRGYQFIAAVSDQSRAALSQHSQKPVTILWAAITPPSNLTTSSIRPWMAPPDRLRHRRAGICHIGRNRYSSAFSSRQPSVSESRNELADIRSVEAS